MANPAEQTESKSLVILFPQASKGNTFLQTVKGQLEGDESIQVIEADTGKEVSDLVQKHGYVLVIFCVRHKEDLSLVLNGLNDWNSFIKGKFLRAIGVSQLNHPQVPPTLMKRGCADLFSATLNPKSLKHKISQSLKILDTYRVQSGGARPQPASSAKEQTSKEKAPVERTQVTWTKAPAMKLASDVWLLRNERDARAVQGRWIIDLIGPGPSAGYWDESPQEKNLWIWKHKVTEDSKTFITDPGEWCFRGRKPDFVADTMRWRFVHDVPELFFRNGEQVVATRFKLSKEGGEIADNSEQAKAKLSAIQKSIEHEVRFKKEKPKTPNDPNVHDLTKDKEEEHSGGFAMRDDEIETAEPNVHDLAPEESQATDPNVHDLTKDKDPEHSGGFAMKEDPEETPFNQAPKPKLKITVQGAQTGSGKPVKATPIELDEDVLVLEVPLKMFAVDQQLIIVLDDGLYTPHSKKRLNAMLKEVLSQEGDTEQISIKIDPELKVSFAPVRTALKERQEEILNFLKAARGW